MDLKKIEVLLERIAVALEELAQATRGNQVAVNASAQLSTAISEVDDGVEDGPIPEAQPKAFSFLDGFLRSRGIQIKTIPPEEPADEVIDRLAVFIGERYEFVSDLIGRIKQAMPLGMPINMNLKGRPQQEISSICQLCTLLHEVAFLEEYQYSKSPRYLLRAKTTMLPKAQRFLSGHWLERFMLQQIKGIYGQLAAKGGEPPPFQYLLNPQIILPNGGDFELDILVALGSKVYWVEAKTGNYQRHVSKYSKFAGVLGLDASHSFMVLADAPESRCEALSRLFGMTVCSVKQAREKLWTVIASDNGVHA